MRTLVCVIAYVGVILPCTYVLVKILVTSTTVRVFLRATNG